MEWKPPLTEHWNGDILGYYVGYKRTNKGDDKPYLFETVEFIKEQGQMHTLTISNLETFTEYAIVVQAFNKIGQGPMSEEVTENTAEGTPTMPPEDVRTAVITLRPVMPLIVVQVSYTPELTTQGYPLPHSLNTPLLPSQVA